MIQRALRNVEKTALGLAIVRAQESRRPDRLFDDPYAQKFVDAALPTFAEGAALLKNLHWFVTAARCQGIVRTRFIDDLLHALCPHHCRQVTLLAAGLDSRAFRLHWSDSMRVFELDLPGVLGFKESVLNALDVAPRCKRITVPVDLREPWSETLLEAGFNPYEPTIWIAEGLLIYLSSDEAAQLMLTIEKLSAANSRVFVEHPTSVGSGAIPDEFVALWKGGLGKDTQNWLTRHGWHTDTYNRAALATSYGRTAEGPPATGYVIAVRPSGSDQKPR